MKEYYKDIRCDENLKGNKNGFIRKGRLYVAPEIMTLLDDDDVKDIVMGQLIIVDELHVGKQVAVYDGEVLMGMAMVSSYPLADTPGFAMVKFLDKKIMSTDFLVHVERLTTKYE